MGIIIPRSTWGPRYANGFAVIGLDAWNASDRETWLHHSVTDAPGPDATLEQDCAHMRHIEGIGQSNFGGGISYTVIVMPSGRAFEGHSLDRRGSHTYQRNDRARAICFAGNYDVTVPGAKMLNAAASVLREWACTLDGGHRDVYATACPGQHAYARIGAINAAATSGGPIEGDDDVSADEVMNFPLKMVQPDGSTKDSNVREVLRHSDIHHVITRGEVSKVKGEVSSIKSALSELTSLVKALSQKVDSIQTGGVSEAEIGRIAKSAVAGDLGDENA